MMKIKQWVVLILLGILASTAIAQTMTQTQEAGQDNGRPQLDPETLTEAQIAQTQVPNALYRLATLYKKKGDLERLVWTLKRLTSLQPGSGDLKLALATTYALQGDKTRTYDLLLAMQRQGLGYDVRKAPDFSKVADTRAWTYTANSLADNLKPFGEGKVAFTLPGGDFLFESLAFDPKRDQFLVGSVRDGTVSIVGKNGKLTPFIKPDAENGLWSVYAMAVAPDSDALYIASTSSVYFKGFSKEQFGKAGVFKFQLSTGKFLNRYLLAPDSQPMTLSSIAVGNNGLVFAADGLRNVIYRLDGGELKLMAENPKFGSLRGLAVSGDSKTLYFADYSQGVFGIDLAGGRGVDLKYDPAKLLLSGVDGLYWYDGNLVIIQNGMSPRRVMRLKLSDDGYSIVKAMPLDSENAAFGLPTFGAIKGDGLYFVANSQKNQYGTYGTPKAGAKLEPVKIFRSDLRFAWDEPGVDTTRRSARLPASSKPGTGVFSNVQGGASVVAGH